MRQRLAFFLFLLPVTIFAVPSGDGIFAIFDTNHGSFTCELFADKAPVTVANFVGLAEGSRPWINLRTGRLEQRPFYDGLTFHRVIDGFMIQSGSPNGNGTDGPGYRFPDEFHPDLIHDQAGILSMANSGFDTNGSQFFITDAPTSWLDYKHAVFGRVIEGMEVVEAISAVETDESDRPETPVVIESITIIRNGAAAQAFNLDRDKLPRLRELPPELNAQAGTFSLRAPHIPDSELFLSYSNDLQTWTRANLVPTLSGDPATASFDLGSLADGEEVQFYRLASVDTTGIPEAYVPESLVGKTLTLDVASLQLQIVLRPDEERPYNALPETLFGTGTGDLDTDTKLGLTYLWSQDKSRGLLLFILDDYVQFDLHLSFRDESSGTFSGSVHTMPEASSANGTFTLGDH